MADLLVKVFLRDGTEKWILVHTEIEGGNDIAFSHRIFQYHYRLLDRYRVPVETIAIFTGVQLYTAIRCSELRWSSVI